MKCYLRNSSLYVIESDETPDDSDFTFDICNISDLKKSILFLINKYHLKTLFIFCDKFLYQNILVNKENGSISKVWSSVLSTYIPQQFTKSLMSKTDNQSEELELRKILLLLDRPLNQHFEAFFFYLNYVKDKDVIVSTNGELNTEIEYDLVIHFGHATSKGLLINKQLINIDELKCKVLYSLGCNSAEFFMSMSKSCSIDCFIGYTSSAFGQIPVNGSGRLFLYTMENCLSFGNDMVHSVNKSIRRLCHEIYAENEINKRIILYSDEQEALTINTMLNYVVIGNAKFKMKNSMPVQIIEGYSSGTLYPIYEKSIILVFESTCNPDDMVMYVTDQQGNKWDHKLNEINIYQKYIYKSIISAYYKTYTGFKYFVIINNFNLGNFSLNKEVDKIFSY